TLRIGPVVGRASPSRAKSTPAATAPEPPDAPSAGVRPVRSGPVRAPCLRAVAVVLRIGVLPGRRGAGFGAHPIYTGLDPYGRVAVPGAARAVASAPGHAENRGMTERKPADMTI